MENSNIKREDLIALRNSLESLYKNLKDGNLESAEYRVQTIKDNLSSYILKEVER